MATLHEIADLRKDYKLKSFSESEANIDPFIQFQIWWEDAAKSDIEEYNAMTVATVNDIGRPSARIVLLKGFSDEGFIFYTNFQSKKGKEILARPQVALVFFWKELERQVRIEGKCQVVDDQLSDAYFSSRPVKSKIGAWASPQSAVIQDRAQLEKAFNVYENKYTDNNIPRPPHWGGFIVKPDLFEFWQGRRSRLHDRIQYTLENNNKWNRSRLAP
ncbi:MAG: pyridoxamine 5'-phosphate oxidase [Ginsengibacter sp.]